MTSSALNPTAQAGISSAEAYERVRGILLRMKISESRIAPDAKLAGLAIDPFEYALLVITLEDAFAIATDDREIAKLRTIQDLADYAKRTAFAQLIEALV